MGDKPDTGTEDRKRIDLSVPQVAGSALAAVAAAVLASTLGVYGTFIGAGVVSVVATCGGTVFQHFFRRTGEQLREVTVQAKVGSRQVPVLSPYKGSQGNNAQGDNAQDDNTRDANARGANAHDATTALPLADAERTQLLGRLDADRTQLLGQVDADRTRMLPRAAADRTQLLKSVDGAGLPPGAAPAKEFNEASVHGTRMRGWKRPVLAAAVVFGVSMGGITAYELLSGGEVGGNGNGTTLQSVFTGGAKKQAPPAPSDPGERDRPSPGTGGSSQPGGTDEPGRTGGGSGSGDPSPSPSPSTSHGSGSGSDSGADSGSGSGKGGTTPTPTPTPSGSQGSGSGSGSADPVTPDPKSGASSAP
ncbi:hypothetical protein OG432_06570 [Streptomyces sp. NBC_00442]|uniref:hypothetical protein n=1 Tax=Streptomyces sp. NBC_00442 TaxID=2903651 RepID=UPI002E1A7EF5